MSANQRLRIATRIHFALLRHFDENVEVAELLKGGAEAREALWVCEASGDPELVRLARAFTRPEEQPVLDSEWGVSTGFGSTGFGNTSFGSTTMHAELTPAPRPSMFDRLGLRPLR